MKKLIFTFCVALSFLASPHVHSTENDYVSFETKGLSQDDANFLAEHGLPADHPAKPVLDEIFLNGRVLDSTRALKAAGFINPKERNRGVVIGRHPKLKGYLLKMYIDTNPTKEFPQWKKRIKGAELIQSTLDELDYNHLLKVPKKWIYNLPPDVQKASHNRKYPKNSVLIVEDMDIYSDSENRELYKTLITPAYLDAMYDILTICLLSDSTWLPNIPFSRDGRIAFVDTEFAGTSLSIWLRLPRLGKNLSPSMRNYWEHILRTRMKKNAEIPGIIQSKSFFEFCDDMLEREEMSVPSFADDFRE